MAGTLTISTLSDGTNSTSSTNCIQGSAKAWVRFAGITTVTVNASYNVSSVTRNAAGNYTIAMTNALADQYYTVAGSLDIDASGGFVFTNCFSTTNTSSSFKIRTVTGAGAAADSTGICVVVNR
jgi:hypothetical protein